MCIDKNEVNRYEMLNEYANKNAVVVLGSTFMHDIPMAELRQSFGIHTDIYNRSLTELKVSESADVIKEIMNTLSPKKLLIQLGEVELKEKADIDSVISEMKSLVRIVNCLNKHCKVVLVTVTNVADTELMDEYNCKLEELAKDTKSQFADITSGSKKSESAYINAFMKLKYFLSDDMFRFNF